MSGMACHTMSFDKEELIKILEVIRYWIMKLEKTKKFAAMFIVYDWKWPQPWAGTETLYKLSIPQYTSLFTRKW